MSADGAIGEPTVQVGVLAAAGRRGELLDQPDVPSKAHSRVSRLWQYKLLLGNREKAGLLVDVCGHRPSRVCEAHP